jgi:hypothetical protein
MGDIFDDWDDYNAERELAPEGWPEELVHLALTCNGGWGLGIKDAVGMRQNMDAGKPPLGDSSWKHELEQQLNSQLHPDVYGIARRIAWAAYRQGILHGELLAKYQ